MPDIDIDFADRDIVLSKLKHRVAKLGTGKKHNTGVYTTEVPHNPVDNLSTIEHKTAEERGYFKLDILNVSIYKDVRDEAHLTELMERKPIWQLLEHKDFSDQVFHLNRPKVQHCGRLNHKTCEHSFVVENCFAEDYVACFFL